MNLYTNLTEDILKKRYLTGSLLLVLQGYDTLRTFRLRIYILRANENLTENIKWNGPNYCFNSEDRITMRIQPPTTKQIQLIFHRGAKKQVQPKEKLIEEHSKLLIWKENDRAIATFKNMDEIENAETNLTEIVKKWINATK